jgi:SAM-dependent methyltransferase
MTDHVRANRAHWDTQAAWYAESAPRSWDAEPSWGIFSVPDAGAGMGGRSVMPDVAGLDVIELGCGTGYVSGWCLRRGARRVVGLDNSAAQLATAARMAERAGVELPLVHGDAERAPFAPASFDVAISEYGAAIWCDPDRWIPEAARLLRPGGTLVFLGNSQLLVLCAPEVEHDPVTPELLRPQRGMHRVEWKDSEGIEFHVSHGDMIRLLRSSGFEVVDLVEVYAEPDSTTPYPWADATWASKWPIEEAWVARRRYEDDR